jgi:DNA (cytosine-5)-methyltransferase 1
MDKLTFGSLFAGIGGFDLGFERAGMVCKWQVEINDYATRVLAKHWPSVHRERDIRECGSHNLKAVDVICGGFPCQDISYAGRGAGLDGERSGLFFEALRVVCELQPRAVVLENVAGLLTRGLDRVLGSLAEIGYDAEWDCLPASAFGAHFRGDRVFIIAHNSASSCLRRQGKWSNPSRAFAEHEFTRLVERELQLCVPAGKGQRISDGVPHRVDRLRGLGNAVVPQVAEYVGQRVVEVLTA